MAAETQRLNWGIRGQPADELALGYSVGPQAARPSLSPLSGFYTCVGMMSSPVSTRAITAKELKVAWATKGASRLPERR